MGIAHQTPAELCVAQVSGDRHGLASGLLDQLNDFTSVRLLILDGRVLFGKDRGSIWALSPIAQFLLHPVQ